MAKTTQNKSRVVNVRMHPYLWQKFVEEAAANELTVSDIIRLRLYRSVAELPRVFVVPFTLEEAAAIGGSPKKVDAAKIELDKSATASKVSAAPKPAPRKKAAESHHKTKATTS